MIRRLDHAVYAHMPSMGHAMTRVLPLFLWLTLVWLGVGTTEAAVLKLYMAPNGNDARSGMSQVEAVKTLARIHALLQTLQPTDAVEVHITSGLYLHQTVEWTYINGESITFTPLNFSKERPVFDGRGDDLWFKLAVDAGVRTELRFRYLQVQNYNTAMDFKGNRNDELSGWNGGNELYGMYFYRIGGRYSRDGSSTAAVSFVNSRENYVANSHFVNIENFDDDAGYLHALYMAHYSNSNVIERNRFAYVSGDPVRVRDASDYNQVLANQFERTGTTAFYSDWYCEAKRPDCSKPTPECPSMGNEFRDNQLYRGYYAIFGVGIPIATFKLNFPDDACGPLPAPRLRTSGNVRH